MAFNATRPPAFLGSPEAWQGFVDEAQKYMPSSGRLALLALVNIPLLAVILNVLRQLVSSLLQLFVSVHFIS